jgi:hypothetical protein
MKEETNKAEAIPDEVKQESLDLITINHPYTPQENEE